MKLAKSVLFSNKENEHVYRDQYGYLYGNILLPMKLLCPIMDKKKPIVSKNNDANSSE